MGKDLVEYFAKEWAIVWGAPATFTIALLIVAGVAYAAAKWRYEAVLDLLNAQLASKDQLLDEHRERMHLIPAKGTEFERYSLPELETASLAMAGSIRGMLRIWRERTTEQSSRAMAAMRDATDEAARSKALEQESEQSGKPIHELLDAYEARIRVRAELLRNEMLIRLEGRAQIEDITWILYERPTNHFGLEAVAANLESLGRMMTGSSPEKKA